MKSDLDYYYEKKPSGIVLVVPFLPLIFVALEIPLALFLIFMVAVNAGGPYDPDPTPFVVGLLVLPFFGLASGVYALATSRKYGPLSRGCAAIGTAVCAVPFVALLIRLF